MSKGDETFSTFFEGMFEKKLSRKSYFVRMRKFGAYYETIEENIVNL